MCSVRRSDASGWQAYLVSDEILERLVVYSFLTGREGGSNERELVVDACGVEAGGKRCSASAEKSRSRWHRSESCPWTIRFWLRVWPLRPFLPFEHMNESTSRPSDEHSTERTDRDSDTLDAKATVLLAIQAASSSFSYRAAEFAYPL
jgi:hypothetical protein